MTPSSYQLEIFRQVADAVERKRRGQPFQHIVVEAVAGAGKTATIVGACKQIPHARCVVVAFGKRNADELQAKLPSNAVALTLHSLGKRAWVETLGGRQFAPEVAVDGHSRLSKLDRIIKTEVDKGTIPRYLRGKVAKLVDLARMHGIVPGSRMQRGAPGSVLTDAAEAQHGHANIVAPSAFYAFSQGDVAVNDVLSLRGLRDDTDVEWEALMSHFDIYVNGMPAQLIRVARDVLRKSIRYGHRIVDYCDMLYLPTLAESSAWRLDGDVVFVDELQDLDHLQRQMILHLVSSGSVFVGCGDPRQAIMAWRGADADSMAKIAAATQAIKLPLSICYRCPASHLAAAVQYVPHIEAAPDAEVGVFERFDEEGMLCCNDVGQHGLDCWCQCSGGNLSHNTMTSKHFKPGDLVICRAKAPLVKAAYYLLKNRVPASILGKDIGRGLVAFVDAMRSSTVTELLKKVKQFTNRVIARACELDDDAAMTEATDRRDVLIAVADGQPDDDDVEAFKARLASLFGDGEDKNRVVTLSTIHRAKGTEADHVWWLDYRKPDPESSGYKHEWQRREAENLRFVSLTRARKDLRLIHSESLK